MVNNKLILVTIMCCLVLSPIVAGLGYSPLGVYGTVIENGESVSDLQVWLKVFADGNEVGSSEIVTTNNDGQFYNLVTVEDDYRFVDVHIFIDSDDEPVQILKNVTTWDDYTISIELTSSEFTKPVSSSGSSAPSSREFEEDFKRIESGDALTDSALREKYGISIDEWKPYEPSRSQEPLIEQPVSVSLTKEYLSEQISFGNKWHILSIILITMCLFIIRHEFLVHKKP